MSEYHLLNHYKSIEPVPPHPIDEAPYISGAWLLLGIAVLLWLRARAPEKVSRFGAALGEGETGAELDPAAAI